MKAIWAALAVALFGVLDGCTCAQAPDVAYLCEEDGGCAQPGVVCDRAIGLCVAPRAGGAGGGTAGGASGGTAGGVGGGKGGGAAGGAAGGTAGGASGGSERAGGSAGGGERAGGSAGGGAGGAAGGATSICTAAVFDGGTSSGLFADGGLLGPLQTRIDLQLLTATATGGSETNASAVIDGDPSSSWTLSCAEGPVQHTSCCEPHAVTVSWPRPLPLSIIVIRTAPLPHTVVSGQLDLLLADGGLAAPSRQILFDGADGDFVLYSFFGVSAPTTSLRFAPGWATGPMPAISEIELYTP